MTTAVVLICVDLSRPHEVLPTLEYWLGRVQSRVGATFARLEKRGSRLPEQLRRRGERNFGADHEDNTAGAVRHHGISIVIAATKYDLFRGADAELKKILGRALRHSRTSTPRRSFTSEDFAADARPRRRRRTHNATRRAIARD